MNIITLMGRMTRDPEHRHTPNGLSVASFSLAVDRGYTPKGGGERQTDFIDCVAWRNTADFVANYFSKGKMAIVVGSLQIRDWEDIKGNKRKSAEVVVDKVYFGEGKNRGDNRAEPSNYAHAPQGDDYVQSKFAEIECDDSDLPF